MYSIRKLEFDTSIPDSAKDISFNLYQTSP